MRLTALVLLAGLARAGEIVLPAPALERTAPVPMVYRTTPQATGKGTLSLTWTDVHGRVVDERELPFELNDETDIGFTLDLRRAAAMNNELRIRLVFEGIDKERKRDHREEEARASFVAKPPRWRWDDYVILMWQRHTAEESGKLKALGINAGQSNGRSLKPPDFLLKNDLRWYAENIATDFYSEYHRWRPDRRPHWAFLDVKEFYKKNPDSPEPFKRHPSLSDPEWLKRVHDRLVESARFHSAYRPVFYSLGDEPGIADLAAYWDFDFSDYSLAEMRKWLRARYPTLAALNRQWGTSFDTWDRVVPDTTNQAMRRADENYSAWSDHKEWMDTAFSRALKMGNDAVRSVDPEAFVGIGGGQMPGWGGYDYAKIARSLTAIEPYDIGNNVEIIRSLNPAMAVVTTAFASGPWEKHRVWYELLHGGRGLIIWDDKRGFITNEGAVGPRGAEVRPYYTELRNGVAAALINSRREADPVAIHYSQASMRIEWMLAQRGKGAAWAGRNSAIERMDSAFLRLRESWCRLIEDLGLQYDFVSYDQVEAGELLRGGYRVLVLPRSTALSEAEARAIREFVEQGGTLIADGEPGTFDEHCRRLEKPRLAGVPLAEMSALEYHQQRLVGKERAALDEAAKIVHQAGVLPPFPLDDPFGVETHRFRNGALTIVGLLGNPQLRVDELGPPEFKSNERFATPRKVRLALPRTLQVYDLRAGKSLGELRELAVALEPYEPALFACSPVPIPGLRLAVPPKLARGGDARIGIAFVRAHPAARPVLRIEVLDPSGTVVPHYSGNLVAAGGAASHLVPVAHNDPAGTWQVRVRDVYSGQVAARSFEVF
jgi:hypothetical protein